GYEAGRARNPRIIYCSVSGFGQTGPYRDRAALDLILQAESGMMSVTGEEGGRGVRAGVSIADLTAGMYADYGSMTAPHARGRARDDERSALAQQRGARQEPRVAHRAVAGHLLDKELRGMGSDPGPGRHPDGRDQRDRSRGRAPSSEGTKRPGRVRASHRGQGAGRGAAGAAVRD